MGSSRYSAPPCARHKIRTPHLTTSLPLATICCNAKLVPLRVWHQFLKGFVLDYRLDTVVILTLFSSWSGARLVLPCAIILGEWPCCDLVPPRIVPPQEICILRSAYRQSRHG